MKNVIYILISLSSLCSTNLFNQAVIEYNNRSVDSNGLVASSEHIDKAITLFEKELDSNPNTIEQTVIYLLKSYYFKAKFSESDKEVKKELLRNGKALGQEFLDRFPNSVEYRYWYLVNLGSWAEVYGILAAAREGVADQMRSHSEKIIKTDPEYKDGGGYFMLGAVHYKSPYIPFLLSWPDNDEAVKWLRKATETGKATKNQNVYFAQALYKQKNRTEATRLLEKVSQTEPSESEYASDWEWIKKARGLLEDWQ